MKTNILIRLISSFVFFGLIAIPAIGTAKDKVDNPLMPTPVMYTEGYMDPFIHLPPDLQSTEIKVFYATNRNSKSKKGKAKYGKDISDVMSVGEATIRFGDKDSTWAEIKEASRQPKPRDPQVPMHLLGGTEYAQFDADQKTGEGATLTPEQQKFVDAINAQLKIVADKQILLYVHGAKFTFETSLTQTAETTHFVGRDLVGVAFAWPTHSDIMAYAMGIDVKRATHSSPILIELIELLAAHTDAEAINIISWSAGGRVMGRAIADLRDKYSDLSSDELRKKFRLKLLLYAAADVPTDEFIAYAPNNHDMTDRLTITQSDDDGTLEFGEKTMKGGKRAGMFGGMDPEEARKLVEPLDRLEMINVSAFKDTRGFDITGHHYWFEHPWVSTDVMINVRTRLPPADRGLEKVEGEGMLRYWGFKKDYPQQIGTVLEKITDGSW